MRNNLVRLGLALSLAAIALVYWPGLYGDFNFDDRPNILDNPRYKFDTLTWDVLVQIVGSGDAGTLKRPLPMLSFAFNIATTGFEPYYFKLWNLVIHLANTVLVFLAVSLLVRALYARLGRSCVSATWVALGTATLWGLHPLNLTSVLYVVQRMNSFSGTFVLMALVFYLAGRLRLIACDRRGWWAIGIGGGGNILLGALCKENAVLAPLLLVTVEGILLRNFAADRRDTRILNAMSILAPVSAMLAVAGVLFFRSAPIFEGYIYRDFSVWERLLTQSRVVWFYLQMILAPVNSKMGLYHDDFIISTGLLTPLSTSLAIGGLLLLAAVAAASFRKQPVLSFAIAWYFVGHLLESTFLPLEMVHEHRNYIPMLGPLFAASFYLCTTRFSSHSKILPALLVLLCCACAAATSSRAYSWGNLIRHAETEVANHPASERATVQLGRIYFTLFDTERDERYFAAAENLFRKATGLSRTQNGAYIGLLKLYYFAGREPPGSVFEEYVARLSSGPAAPSATTLLRNLSDCNMFEYCKVPDDDMLRAFDALLSNESAHPTVKALTCLFLAQYLVDRLGDGLSGIHVLERAKELDPRQLAARRNLIRLYRLSGQLEKARDEMAEVRKLDRLREIGPELDQEDGKLHEAFQAQRELTR
ncbi:MAG: hypothetical protein ABL931_00770 [Usitatibacteraceae bacterium]